MKRLHRADLYAWSVFDEARDVDFNGLLWVRPEGNVLVDPLPLTPHDHAHLAALGGAKTVVMTTSDHTRASAALAKELGARLYGPRAERDAFPIPCEGWLGEGDVVVPGLVAHALDGSKTPGELALSLEGSTLIFGDLVRAHRAGALMFLPTDKLKDAPRARASVRRVAEVHAGVETVLVGDGFCAFGNGGALLRALVGLDAHEQRTADADARDTLPSGADDSGQFAIPAARASIPAPRAGARCSFCERPASERRLVSGTRAARRETPAICASCAAGLRTTDAPAACDFCDQTAPVTVTQKDTIICRDCIDLALTIFGDSES